MLSSPAATNGQSTNSYWPSPPDYLEAVQSPSRCFADTELSRAEVVEDALGLPQVCSGNFACVFHLQAPREQRAWAVKCFTRQVPGLRERYDRISQHLKNAALPYTIGFEYLPRGILVRGEWFPVVKMDWVTGDALHQAVSLHLDEPRFLKDLYRRWLKVEPLLRNRQTAHGDLQHGNILLVREAARKDERLRLIDYDGLWAPDLADFPPAEAGHPDYQHPDRARLQIFSEEVDRFPHLVIAAAIRCLSHQLGRTLWDRFSNGDNLLFTEKDFTAPHASQLLLTLWHSGDAHLRAWAGRIVLAAHYPLMSTPPLEALLAGHELKPLSAAEAGRVRELLREPIPLRRGSKTHPRHAADDLLERAFTYVDYAQRHRHEVVRDEALRLARRAGPAAYRRFLVETLRRFPLASQWRVAHAQVVADYRATACPVCFEILGAWESTEAVDERRFCSPVLDIHPIGQWGLWEGYEIASRHGAWDGSQPGRWLTRRCVFLVACLIGGPFLVAKSLGVLEFPDDWLGAQLLMAIVVLVILTLPWLFEPRFRSVEEMARHLAETVLRTAPPSRESAAFVGGLCQGFVARGGAGLDPAWLEKLLQWLAAPGLAPWSWDCLIPALNGLQQAWKMRQLAPHAVLPFLSKLQTQTLQGQLPISFLEGVCKEAQLLEQLSPVELVVLCWRFCANAHDQGWTVADVQYLREQSEYFADLLRAGGFDTPRAVGMTWAALRMESHLLVHCPVAARNDQHGQPGQAEQSGESGQASESAADAAVFAKDLGLLLTTPQDNIWVNREGVVVKGQLCRLTDTYQATPVKQFVQTGWANESHDSEPEGNSINNFPVGYERLVGYHLASEQCAVVVSPDELSAFQVAMNIYGVHLMDATYEAMGQHATGKAAALFRRWSAECPRCGQRLLPVLGSFGRQWMEA
uniref:Protein kinase domain-containing protein n=1 Tax=Schlesneria paludicola TaxID=360056 RepID=A0A7C4QN75_9PLAN